MISAHAYAPYLLLALFLRHRLRWMLRAEQLLLLSQLLTLDFDLLGQLCEMQLLLLLLLARVLTPEPG